MSVRGRSPGKMGRRGRRGLRAPYGWAIVVQGIAFVRKELAEILRQPRLLILLVLGPFVLLLLFGAGYKDTSVKLRTAFVGPTGSVYERAVSDYSDRLDEYIEPAGFTSDRAAALRRLEDGDVDAVVVFPDDALKQVLGGHSATIRILHTKLDPFQRTAIEIASRLAVQEANASVLGALAGSAQNALSPVGDTTAALTQAASELSQAVAAGDTASMANIAQRAAGTLRDTRLVMTASRDVIERLGGTEQAAATGDLADRIAATEASARQVGAADGTDIATRATDLANALRDVAGAIPKVSSVDPQVLVRPFQADPQRLTPVSVDPTDYFAPSAIVLLLQHLALTFAALSLVRDRELGLFELLRVGPLSSMQILVGKTIAYLAVGVAVGAVLLATAVGVLGVPFEGELSWIAVTVVLVLLASLALGMMLSMISKSETQAVQYAMLSLLAGMFFSGFILDLSQLAFPYRALAYLLPVTYGINVLRDVMLRGLDADRTDLAGLVALTVAYGGIAVLQLRRRLRLG